MALIVSRSHAFIPSSSSSPCCSRSDTTNCFMPDVLRTRHPNTNIIIGTKATRIDTSSVTMTTQLQSPSKHPLDDLGPSSSTITTEEEADLLFDAVDVNGSGSIDLDELTAHLSLSSSVSSHTSITPNINSNTIQTLFSHMDTERTGAISRDAFRHALLRPTTIATERDADIIFDLVDADGSGAIDLNELTRHLSTAGYGADEIRNLFIRMKDDDSPSGEVSRTAFRRALLDEGVAAGNEDFASSFGTHDTTTRGYFLNSVKQTLQPLGPIGRLSQKVETSGPFKRIYYSISNLCGIDTKRISKLGVSFALSYSILSHINGAVSFSIAWFISCKRTGLSPLMPGQWRSLLAAYSMIYGIIQLIRPFRVAAAIGMSKLSAEYLEMTQSKFNCSRGVAIGVQYMVGWVMMGSGAFLGVSITTMLTGVPIWGP